MWGQGLIEAKAEPEVFHGSASSRVVIVVVVVAVDAAAVAVAVACDLNL